MESDPKSFIGLQMAVTVRDPPVRLKGIVSDIVLAESLTLSNVWLIDSNRWEPRLTLRVDNIVDLKHIVETQASTSAKLPSAAAPPATNAAQPAPVPSFVDPAILSLGRRKPATSTGAEPQAHVNPVQTGQAQPAQIPSIEIQSASVVATPTAAVFEQIKELKISGPAAEEPGKTSRAGPSAEAARPETPSQKRKRRNRKSNSHNIAQDDLHGSPQEPRVKATGKGKGWRQTPILESTSSFQPFNSLKTTGGRVALQNDNGWASEDVTDVQEMGDFDFEGGLAKFDKRNIFEQMRKEDQVDEADRLVSHNRQAQSKPGTAGGKNLHYSENVLDMPATSAKAAKERQSKDKARDFWNSEADDAVPNGGERHSGREMGSRQSSRRGESKMSTSRKSQSRKTSAVAGSTAPHRVNSGVRVFHSDPFEKIEARTRHLQRLISEHKQLVGNAAAHGFYLLPSNRRIETVSPLQMLNLENIAQNELGMTEDMMTENAGRGIAEVTLTALTDPAIQVRRAASMESTGTSPPPTVVILAGNNKSGIRAIAAGRHLRNKGINIVVCLVGFERGERDLLEDMRQQLRLFRNFGGRVFTKIDLFEHLRKTSIPTISIDAPRSTPLTNPAAVTLIIDALLGLAISFDELRTGDQATVYELIEWANRNEAFVLAVDVPTGIDPSSGKVNVIDSNQLYVKPRYVVALGAPKRGLLEAIAAAENEENEGVEGRVALSDDASADWSLYVADMGLGAAVWKKAGTKIRRGIDFDDKWVLEMKYRGAPPAEEERV